MVFFSSVDDFFPPDVRLVTIVYWLLCITKKILLIVIQKHLIVISPLELSYTYTTHIHCTRNVIL